MTAQMFIGVDDTDVEGSPGTGRVARGLADHLGALGLGMSLGVTRHQLLVDPRIPYTSHNSSLCIGLESTAEIGAVAKAAREYLEACAVEGADPGLCVAEDKAVTSRMQRFGQEAKVSVLAVEDALKAVLGSGVVLASIAGGPEGVIGALAAVGLRAHGNDGRFVDLPGIREVGGVVTVQHLMKMTAVVAVVDDHNQPLAGDELIDSQDWLRASLVGGVPVLKVQQDLSGGERWVSYERRNRNSSTHH